MDYGPLPRRIFRENYEVAWRLALQFGLCGVFSPGGARYEILIGTRQDRLTHPTRRHDPGALPTSAQKAGDAIPDFRIEQ
ncbi:MAG TPA: hypothetical protein VKR31_01205 [Rhizomicrobium sp.]|nr:hypothetical protein [Rhizomicrobium sp.]